MSPNNIATNPPGAVVNGTITLTGPAPAGGAVVNLSRAQSPAPPASPAGFVTFVASSQVTIPANSSSGSFSMKVNQALSVFVSPVTVEVTATLGASQVSANVIFTA